MFIKKILEIPSPSLDEYYNKRENVVKLCNEVSDDYYESIIDMSPEDNMATSLRKIEKISIEGETRDTIVGTTLHEFKWQKWKQKHKT